MSVREIRFVAPLTAATTGFLFLPLIVYLLNLGSVTTPKQVILQGGITATLISTVSLFVLSYVPELGNILLRFCQIFSTTLFLLIVFPNKTGELSGLESFLMAPNDFASLGKILFFAGLSYWILKKQPSWMRALSRSTLGAALATSLFIFLTQTSSYDESRKTSPQDRAEFCKLGSTRNAIVIVLDTFTGYRFAEILNEHPEWRKEFEGFVFYPKAIAPAVNTPAGISAILTGSLDLAIHESRYGVRNTASIDQSFLAEAKDHGFRSAYIGPLQTLQSSIPHLNEQTFFDKEPLSFREIQEEYYWFETIALARVLPRSVYCHLESNVNRLFFSNKERLSSMRQFTRAPLDSRTAFLYWMNHLKVGEQEKRILFLHSKLTHSPFSFQETGTFVKNGGADFAATVYATKLLVSLVHKLKALGCFRSSMIIVASDHGGTPIKDRTMGGLFSFELSPAAFSLNPLLMIKPPENEEPFRVSAMSVWLGDVSASVRDFLGSKPRDNSDVTTRSLLGPDDASRALNLPIFFRPDQESYHTELSRWKRVNVSGPFEAYGQAAAFSADQLFKQPGRVKLFVGQDFLFNETVKRGFLVANGIQYRAAVEFNDLLLSKRTSPGVTIIAKVHDGAQVFNFDSVWDLLRKFRSVEDDAVLFVVALHVPAAQLQYAFRSYRFDNGDGDLINVVYARGSHRNDRPLFKMGAGNVSLSIDWQPE